MYPLAMQKTPKLNDNNSSQVNRLENYLHLGRPRAFSKGSIVFSPGSELNTVIYIKSGCLSQSIVTDNGQTMILFYYRKHNAFMTSFLREYHELQICAVENTVVYYFTIDQIMSIFNNDPNVLFDFLQNIHMRTYYLMNKAKELTCCSSSGRVYRFLYNLCSNEGKLIGNCYQIDRRITIKTIAEETGTHYVTVSRLLSKLQKQQIIKKERDKIFIYDLYKISSLI